MKKTLLCVLLSGCAASSDWNVQHVVTGSNEFDASKLVYHACNTLHGIDLEFHRSNDQLKLYLVVHERPVQPAKEEDREAKVTTVIQGDKHVFSAYILEGGQKLLASAELQAAITAALKEKKEVVLECAGYVVSVDPGLFANGLSQLDSAPLEIPVEFALE